MELTTLEVDEDDGVLVVTLNRPEARNALNSRMWEEMCTVVDHLEGSSGLAGCVITNTGDCFCAGSDLKEIEAGTYHAPARAEGWGFAGIAARAIAKPVVAAVNGKALGGGAEILLACDLAVISSDGVVGFPEVARSLLASGGGGLLRIGRSVTVKRAMELALTADPITAQTALEWGLVNRVAEPGQVLDVAKELLRRVLRNGPTAVQWTKRAIYESMDKPWLEQSDGWRMMFDLGRRIGDTQDAVEGARAFAEKRAPHWSGR